MDPSDIAALLGYDHPPPADDAWPPASEAGKQQISVQAPRQSSRAQQLATLKEGLGRCRALAVRQAPTRYRGYDAEEEERSYCRALLPKADLDTVKEEVAEGGYWTMTAIRTFLEHNSTSRRVSDDGVFILDAEAVREIDVRTDKCVFILPDNSVFSREELMEQYPFAEFGQEPEEIFAQQEVGVFPAHKSFMNQDQKDYLVRDYGDDEFEFLMLEDEVGRLTRGDKHVSYRPAERTVRTKVFLARDGWEDFQVAVKHVRSMKRLFGNLARKGGNEGQLLAMLMGPAAFGGGAALEDGAGIERREAAELRAREEAAARREKELRRQEEAARDKEAELRKLEADLLAQLGGL